MTPPVNAKSRIVTRIQVGGTAEEIGPLRTAFPDDHPLAGMQTKLDRAREHLETLNTEMYDFLKREPYSFALEKGRRRNEYVLRAYASELPPLQWSAVIGDFLQNLRSSLEYLAWELARAGRGGREPDERNVTFPICYKHKEFTNWGSRKISDLPPDAQAIIKELQPYNRSIVSPSGVVNMHLIGVPRYRGHPLWRLNELARRDRHQALRVISAATWSAGGSSLTELPFVLDSSLQMGPFKDGSVIARWVLREPINLEGRELPIRPTVSLELDDPDNPKVHSVIMVLGRLLEHIDGEVVPRLERFV